jgi:hypothetical protein
MTDGDDLIRLLPLVPVPASLAALQAQAGATGLSALSPDEIEAEIAAVRAEHNNDDDAPVASTAKYFLSRGEINVICIKRRDSDSANRTRIMRSGKTNDFSGPLNTAAIPTYSRVLPL